MTPPKGETPDDKSGKTPMGAEDHTVETKSEGELAPIVNALTDDIPLSSTAPTVLGRYEIVGMLGRGGMATVYLGRSAGEAGFARIFAIKVLHPHLTDDQEFVTMLLDEGQIAARLHHPNVVPIVDLGSQGEFRYVVLDYIEGCSLSDLLAAHRDSRPPRLIVPIVLDALAGLHAAHTLTDDDGNALGIVHRDISPQNILVGVDGSARITDFGVAKAKSSISSTLPGQLKGKIAFMSPEQIRGTQVDRRSDIFSAGCLLWSALTGRRLFRGDSDPATMTNILSLNVPPPSTIGLMPPAIFDDICLRALERDRDKRWQTAAEMEEALRDVAQKNGMLGPRREVADWVTATFDSELKARRAAVGAAARRQAGPSSSDSHPGASGLRMIPSIGGSRESQLSVDITPHPDTYGRAMRTAEPGAAASRRWSVVAIAAAALCVGGLGVWLAVRSPAAPDPPASPAASSPPVAAPPTATAPAVASAPPPPPAASAAIASNHPAASAAAPPPPPATPAPVKQPPRGWKPPPPKATPNATPAQPPAGQNVPWTPDSPLPPQ
jgi:eukaryotic-like serine/threonine-protein kinase